jgi:peptidoglycan/LPS O-acetylase OafA/YrhL
MKIRQRVGIDNLRGNLMGSLGNVLERNRGIGPGFDFLRIFLATCIVAFHAFLLTGHYDWMVSTPIWFVEYALVPMFFALSGFLITSSALRLSLSNFLINRGLRIVPALGVDIFLCALIIGPLMTTLPLSTYFSDPRFSLYFLNIVGYIHYLLPGVFETHHDIKVNGALWTVPYEILCYVIASFFIIFGWLRSSAKVMVFTAAMVAVGSAIQIYELLPHLPAFGAKLVRFTLLSRESQIVTAFLCGVIAYQLKDSIPYSKKLLFVCVALCVGAALMPEYAKPVASRFVLLPAITYITVYLGLTKIWIPQYFRTGDYSYGVYLYHDPLLQIVIAFFPAICMTPFWGAGFTFLVGLPMVLVLANFSWHYIEKPILAQRKKFSFVARVRGVEGAPATAAPAATAPRSADTAVRSPS